MAERILVINPGSTSTKLAIFEHDQEPTSTSLHHGSAELAKFSEIAQQRSFRQKLIVDWLASERITLNSLTAIVARGGLLAPIPGGTYLINGKMIEDLEQGIYGKHASNLAALIAHELASDLEIPAFIVDPVVVDEMLPVARISGNPHIKRQSIFHALNQKASAKKTAQLLGRNYEELTMIVAHLGGGISIGAHQKGQVIDVNNALTGEGPFSPERAGGLPTDDLVKFFFANSYSKSEALKLFAGQSGLVGHLGTNDSRKIVTRMQAGDGKARFYFEAMCYQVAKEIGRLSAVLSGNIDQIVLTGGLAYSSELVEQIRIRVEFIAPITVLAGENELEALAFGALRVLDGHEKALTYFGKEMN